MLQLHRCEVQKLWRLPVCGLVQSGGGQPAHEIQADRWTEGARHHRRSSSIWWSDPLLASPTEEFGNLVHCFLLWRLFWGIWAIFANCVRTSLDYLNVLQYSGFFGFRLVNCIDCFHCSDYWLLQCLGYFLSSCWYAKFVY